MLCPPLSSGLLPTRASTAQAAKSARLIPKILHSHLYLGGAGEACQSFISLSSPVTPTKEGDRKVLAVSEVLARL